MQVHAENGAPVVIRALSQKMGKQEWTNLLSKKIQLKDCAQTAPHPAALQIWK